MANTKVQLPKGVELPEGVRHMHGAMYLVRFDLLKVPDPEARTEGKKEYEFRNPRGLTESGQAVLFDKKKNEEMRESIREKTLMTPFICRWKNDGGLTVQMVGGERRHRAISFLTHKKEMAKDSRTVTFDEDLNPQYDYNPADKVYEYVLCQIYHAASDIDALSLAYTENDCRVNQGPGQDVAMVIELRECGATDEKILATMSKDEKWLRDTDNIISGLPVDTLKDLIEDRIERPAALEILHIQEKYGADMATQATAVAHEAAERDYKRKFEKLAHKLEEAREEWEIAGGAVANLPYQDSPDVEGATIRLGEANAKVDRTLKEKASAKPVVTPVNVKSGLRVVRDDERRPRTPGGGSATPPAAKSTLLRPAKIKECYLEPLVHLSRSGGKSAELDDAVASPSALNLAVKLIRGIMDGDTECVDIVRLHYKNKSG